MAEDNFAAARRFLDAAEAEARSLRSQVQRLTMEAHTLRRQAERVQQANARLQARVAKLEVEREQALEQASASARATRDHAARVA